MGELEFSRGEVEDLAQKLTSPDLQLSTQEQALLLAIFSAASNQVRSSDAPPPVTGEPTLANLHEELINAFIPGDATEFIIDAPLLIIPPKGPIIIPPEEPIIIPPNTTPKLCWR